MSNMDNKEPLIKTVLSFILFLILFVIVAYFLSDAIARVAPNTNSLFGILCSFILGLPIGIYLFFNSKFIKATKLYQRILFPVLIFPLCILLSLGWNLYQQRPENLFKIFVMDPIPSGVSNIQGIDISGGFDLEILVAFDATPEAIEIIIKEHELKINESPYNIKSDIPFEYFPEINSEQDWTLYQKAELEKVNWWSLWVNADKTTAIFQLIDG